MSTDKKRNNKNKNNRTTPKSGSGVRSIFTVSFILALVGVGLIWFLTP
jgi:hypothetical protein